MRGAMQIAEQLGAAVLATFLVMPAAAQTCPGVVGVEDFDEYNQEPDDVAMDGDYAYTADTYGLTVYDLSDPTHPAPVAQVLLPDDGVGIALSGGMAYVADASGILHVIDISDPTAPAEVGSIQTPGVARDVAVSGTLAVVGITVTSVYSIDPQGALQVVDVSDPASPTLRGIVGTATYEGAVVLSGLTPTAAGRSSISPTRRPNCSRSGSRARRRLRYIRVLPTHRLRNLLAYRRRLGPRRTNHGGVRGSPGRATLGRGFRIHRLC